MFYVDINESVCANPDKLRGWLPTRELADMHVASWPDDIKKEMSVIPGAYIAGVTVPRRGTPPRMMTEETTKALNDHNANVARMVSSDAEWLAAHPGNIITPKDPVEELAYRLWSVTPAEVQDTGLTRSQWYAERIREEFARSTWQPWDTAPRDGSYFDAWVEPLNRFQKARRIPHVHFCTIGNGFWAHEHGTIDVDDLESLGNPTHWRPEPEGPKK